MVNVRVLQPNIALEPSEVDLLSTRFEQACALAAAEAGAPRLPRPPWPILWCDNLAAELKRKRPSVGALGETPHVEEIAPPERVPAGRQT